MAGGAHLWDQEPKQLLTILQKILQEPFRFLMGFLSKSIQMCALIITAGRHNWRLKKSPDKRCDIPVSGHEHVKRSLVCYLLMVYANLILF